ncbi:MAG: PKD domain-containing protein [Actinomycetota bacterium]
MTRVRAVCLFAVVIVLVMPARATARGSAGIVRTGHDARVRALAQRYTLEQRNGPSSYAAAASTPAYPPSASGTAGMPALVDDFSSVESFEPQPCPRRRVGGTWGSTLSFCVSGPSVRSGASGPGRRQAASPFSVARILADRALALAPKPRIQVAPARAGLTGLDSYFWLDPSEPIRASAGVGGLVVAAEARPVQYVWDFGDGDERVTSDPGRPWASGRVGSISHLYETRGSYDLSVEQIWEARWRIAGGAWRTLGLFSNSDARAYGVRQVVPVLVPSLG